MLRFLRSYGCARGRAAEKRSNAIPTTYLNRSDRQHVVMNTCYDNSVPMYRDADLDYLTITLLRGFRSTSNFKRRLLVMILLRQLWCFRRRGVVQDQRHTVYKTTAKPHLPHPERCLTIFIRYPRFSARSTAVSRASSKTAHAWQNTKMPRTCT